MSAYKRRDQKFNDKLSARVDKLKKQGKITPTLIHQKPATSVESEVYRFFSACVRAVKDVLK